MEKGYAKVLKYKKCIFRVCITFEYIDLEKIDFVFGIIYTYFLSKKNLYNTSHDIEHFYSLHLAS